MKTKWFFFIALSLGFFSSLSQAENIPVRQESGEIYVQGSGDTYSAYTAIPTTKKWTLLRVTPRKDPDASSNSVVGNYDFKISRGSLLPVNDYEYREFSYDHFPYVEIDDTGNRWNEVFGTKPIFYIGNTPTAADSGDANNIGQWYEWATYLLR